MNMKIWEFSTSGAEAGLIQDNYVSTMAADALAPCVTRPSAVTVLSMYVIYTNLSLP